jgi:SAM-dependent methyltransferase
VQLSARRRDLTRVHGERWRPPAFAPSHSRTKSVQAPLRRLLDLQAASIWRDLRVELSEAKGSVLDVGCGSQPYRELIGAKGHYQGLDIEDAAERFRYPAADDVIVVNGYPWPLANTTVDIALCTEVAEHVLDPAALFREIHRVLKPDGLLLATVPFSARWHYVPYDYWRFTPAALAHLLSQAGFTRVAVYARGNPLTVASQKALALMLPPILDPRGSLLLRWIQRICTIPLIPIVALIALIGRASLARDWGEDCLGYTILGQP